VRCRTSRSSTLGKSGTGRPAVRIASSSLVVPRASASPGYSGWSTEMWTLALRSEVVDLVRPDLFDQPIEAARVGHVSVVKCELGPAGVVRTGVLKVVDAAPIQ